MIIQYKQNPGGPKLGVCPDSGVKLICRDGLWFKDHSRTGELLPFEDWRLSPEERTRDLLERLTLPQMAGLMLHHLIRQDGQPLPQEIENYYIHGFAPMMVGLDQDPAVSCSRSNEIQAMMEKLPLAIPAFVTAEGVNESKNGKRVSPMYSCWPRPLGIAATFNPDNARRWGEAVSREYRAVGVTNALEPQIDIATDPRWNRFFQTFGEGAELTTQMARAFVDGLQTTVGSEARDGWGSQSVCATAKHFPGGGSGEGGRDAHFNTGKYAVYPGANFEEHLKSFQNGAMKLDGPTGYSAFIMPYYTISYEQDQVHGENVGNGYSTYILQDILRNRLGYQGGIFSDFSITKPCAPGSFFAGKAWGVEEYSQEARHLKSILAGMCVFGSDSNGEDLNKAVETMTVRYGEGKTKDILKKAVYYRLVYSFRQGMFENPYLEPEESSRMLPAEEAVAWGRRAQRESIIMLKNSSALPQAEKKKVFIPKRHRGTGGAVLDLKFATQSEAAGAGEDFLPVDENAVRRRFELVATPEEADFAIVFMEEPNTGSGWSASDLQNGGNGYLPISLQYRSYTAIHARKESIAGGDYYESFRNRSYFGKTVAAENECDLDTLITTKTAMGTKPVIACIKLTRPVVLKETEPFADGILVYCDIEDDAVLDVLSGAFEPSGLLPMQMPADMETVETQYEDVPFDMECYRDSQGNVYDYGFGLNWKGVIDDVRTRRYGRKTN